MSYHIQFRRNGRCVKKMGDYPTKEAAVADGEALVAAGTIPAGVSLFACEGGSKARANPAKKRSASKTKAKGTKKNPGVRKTTMEKRGLYRALELSYKDPDSFQFYKREALAAGIPAADIAHIAMTGRVPARVKGATLKNPSTRTRSNPHKLTVADKKVIDAFIAGKPAATAYLTSTGKQLDINGMGGTGVAKWSADGLLHVYDLGSKTAETVYKAVMRKAPLLFVAPDSQWAMTAKQRQSVRDRTRKSQWATPKVNPKKKNPRAHGYKPGDRVRVTGGPDDGRVGVVVPKSRIPTDGRGVPKLSGHYHRMSDMPKFVAIQFDDGSLALEDRVAHVNPRILGHTVTKKKAAKGSTYTVKPYGKSFKSKAGATKWLQGHVKRESKVNPTSSEVFYITSAPGAVHRGQGKYDKYVVTNFDGSWSAPALHVTHGTARGFGGSYSTMSTRFIGPDGRVWSGVHRGGNNNILRAKPLKKQPRR